MGFFDKVKGAVGKTVAVIGKAADAVADDIKYRQELKKIKLQMLEKFEMPDLKGFCKARGIGEPASKYWDLLKQKYVKITLTRKHYVEYILSRSSVDQIKEYALRRRIKIPSVVMPVKGSSRPQTEIDPSVEADIIDEFDAILSLIGNEFNPEKVRDEKEFENQLAMFLKLKLKDNSVITQCPTTKGKIDVVIDNKYALELKIADGVNSLRLLHGQILDYKETFDNIAVVLLDPGILTSEDILSYTERYKKEGIRSLVLQGDLRRRNRTKFVLTKVRA